MLSIQNIRKSYVTGAFVQAALDGITLHFRQKEFVAILGTSGSGKTTCLNVVGGLDQYDEGDLVINGQSTRNFRDEDWDAYRNNSVGFIFQSYNLIGHLSIVDNVELGMTLSGVSAKVRRAKALDVLERVGLKDHVSKKPGQLSGGQMQRVAIARALANDPDIILADEPTGALDTATSKQIMDLIKEVAKDKLVIMVTHNPELARTYADRIVEFADGNIIADSNPVTEQQTTTSYKLRKTGMRFTTALKLSFNNILTKKGRTLLTAFASSIGIIGIALILSLSNGFDKQIQQYQSDTLSSFPIIISRQVTQLDQEKAMQRRQESLGIDDGNVFPEEPQVYPYDSRSMMVEHVNVLSQEYLDHLAGINKDAVAGMAYMRAVSFNLLRSDGEKAVPVSIDSSYFQAYPKGLTRDESYLESHFDVLSGTFAQAETDLMLVVDSRNRLESKVLTALGFDADAESVAFEDLIGKEYKLILNDDYYNRQGDFFTLKASPADMQALYESENAVTLRIAGILRAKEDRTLSMLSQGVIYGDALTARVLENAATSEIVTVQKDAAYNVLSGQPFDLDTEEGRQARDMTIAYLGGSDVPVMITVYPNDFEAKDIIVEHLEAYNLGREPVDQVEYTDLAGQVADLSSGIMNAITLVLVAFASISLVVSLIMIAIITYISVLERTREIGVLRALGARKKDVTRVFSAETFIIGVTSGLLGIGIAALLILPINQVLLSMTGLKNVAQLNPLHAVLLVAISVLLTLLGGWIPSKMAAKRDPVAALRAE